MVVFPNNEIVRKSCHLCYGICPAWKIGTSLSKWLIIVSASIILNALANNGWTSPRIALSFEQSVGYDDNIFLSKGSTEEDFTSLTGIGLSLNSTSHYLLSNLNYYFEYEAFSKNEQLDNDRHVADLRMKIDPTPTVAINIADYFSSSEELDFTQSGLESRPLSSYVRHGRTVNKFDAAIIKKLTGRSSFNFGYTHFFEDVDTLREVDEEIDSFGIGFNYLFGKANRHIFHLDFKKKNYQLLIKFAKKSFL